MFKASEYNFIWSLDDQKALLYNSFSGSIIDIDKSDLSLLDNNRGDGGELSNDEKRLMREILIKEGFIIEDYVDEKKILDYRNGVAKHRKDEMNLTIIPTYKCNLNCFYCYQDRGIGTTMTTQMQDNLMAYIRHKLPNIKKLHVTWFGGEPLLTWDMIVAMSEQMIESAREGGCDYSANMVTNGFLFDENKMNQLVNLKIKLIQITLDGLPEENAKRKQIQGDPQASFEKIIGIIEGLLDREIHVNVRVNLDLNNESTIKELMGLIEHRPAGRANWYPGRIASTTAACKNIESSCLDLEAFAQTELDFYQYALAKGLLKDYSDILPKSKAMFCGANHINSFVMDPLGDVYKCWDEVGNIKMRVANMKEQGVLETTPAMNMHQMKWVTCSPYDFVECPSCKLLPICMGGCAYKYIAETSMAPDCLPLKQNLETFVKRHYYCTKTAQLLEDIDMV